MISLKWTVAVGICHLYGEVEPVPSKDNLTQAISPTPTRQLLIRPSFTVQLPQAFTMINPKWALNSTIAIDTLLTSGREQLGQRVQRLLWKLIDRIVL